VGVLNADYADVRAAWLKHREISSRGAVLVRPDRYVAYRSAEEVADPTAALKSALEHILATQLA
jgi:2,4-dichlorophenol 6-monooxygenase